MLADHNLFATILTHAAPSSNYRGEGEQNRTVIQRISRRGQEYAVVSPEAMRNALREQLALRGLPSNRSRLDNEEQLAVEFKEHPDASRYADDFLFGYMVAEKEASKEMKKLSRQAKRDSVLRMNMAVALSPFRYEATFHQSPLNAGKSPWRNAATSVLLHRENSYTAFQYPFALALRDCTTPTEAPRWTAELLRAVGELSNVAGGHARSLFEMAPRSIVARLSRSLVSGYESYGFREDGSFPELARLGDDLPADEFWIGGEVVRSMDAAARARLQERGAHLDDNPQRLLGQLSERALGVAS